MVSAYDVGDDGSCLSDSAPHTGYVARTTKEETGGVTQPAQLLPLAVPEVRHLIWWLVWRKVPTPEQIVRWSRWRRTHQAHAKRAHYKRTTAQHEQLQL